MNYLKSQTNSFQLRLGVGLVVLGGALMPLSPFFFLILVPVGVYSLVLGLSSRIKSTPLRVGTVAPVALLLALLVGGASLAAFNPEALERETSSQVTESETPVPEASESTPTATPNSSASASPRSSSSSSGSTSPTTQTEAQTASNLTTLINSLQVAVENRTGYNRELFRHWVDADGDGCDTRDEVLIAESLTPVTIGAGCSLSGGTWLSPYDMVSTTNASGFDVDHLVPLAEAWDSGASNWDSATRQAFANDLDFSMSLIAVTASSNRSKSDRDPAEWLPTNTAYHCEYAVAWVQVKVRWKLTIDSAEKEKLLSLANSCGGEALEFSPSPANVSGGNAATSPTTAPAPAAPVAPAAPAQPSSNCQAGQVDINTASEEQLMTIIHIGTTRVAELVSLRPYRTIDGLDNISGIGDARMADIRAQGIACVG
jgi:DNA uptake protein ComE-like DNA-binding protein